MQVVLENYTFNVSARTITVASPATVIAERVALITDITTGKILYNFAAGTVGLTASGNVITLSTLQGAEQSTDHLRIDYTALPGDDTYALAFTHTAVAVGTSSVTALAASGTRQYALFVNDSANTMYLNIGGTASAGTGIRLNAGGGAYEMTIGAGNLSTAAITVVAAAGSAQNLLVTAA